LISTRGKYKVVFSCLEFQKMILKFVHIARSIP
jgi:hypothetical protein